MHLAWLAARSWLRPLQIAQCGKSLTSMLALLPTRPRSVHFSGPLNETALDALSCAVAASVAESNTVLGDTDTLANCTCTDLPCRLGVLTFTTALQEVVAMGRLHHRKCATNLSIMFCSVEGGVTESGSVGDRAHDQTVCASISMVHGWMRSVSKRLVSGRRKKGETSTSLSTAHG